MSNIGQEVLLVVVVVGMGEGVVGVKEKMVLLIGMNIFRAV